MRSMLNRLFGQHSPAGSSGPSAGQFGLILLVLAFGPPFATVPLQYQGSPPTSLLSLRVRVPLESRSGLSSIF